MSALSPSTQPQPRRQRPALPITATLTVAAVALFVAAPGSYAQSNLPSAPTPSVAHPATAPATDQNSDQQVLPPIGAPSGFSGTTTGSGPSATRSTASDTAPTPHSDADTTSGRRHSQRSSAQQPFKIPHSFSKTTDSGTKFQFTLPRVGVHAGSGQMASPLDGGSRSRGGGSSSSMFPTAFPSADNFMQPSGTPSSDAFDTASDTPPDAFSGSRGAGGHGGAGGGSRGGGAGSGGPGVDMKSSIFDLHMGMSMKELGGNFSSNSGTASPGAGGANDFGLGGSRSDGGRGAGPRLSLGLRF